MSRPKEAAVPVDEIDRAVGPIPGLLQAVALGGHIQNPAALGEHTPAFKARGPRERW